MKTSFTDFIKILGNGPWAAEDPILVVTYNISEERMLVEVARQIILEIIKFEIQLWSSILGKKDPATIDLF